MVTATLQYIPCLSHNYRHTYKYIEESPVQTTSRTRSVHQSGGASLVVIFTILAHHAYMANFSKQSQIFAS